MKSLLLTYDLSPPWDSGLKVYGRGLKSALGQIDGMDLSIISRVEDIPKDHNDYDFVHVVLTGRDPFTKALKYFKKATVFKHIVTPSISLKSTLSTNLCYSMMNRFEDRLVKCFSSRFVADSYYLDGSIIVPPSVDTKTFQNVGNIDEAKIVSILENSVAKSRIDNIKHRQDDALVLYSGPLTKDRFPYEKVLAALKGTKSKLLIIGRPTNNGAEITRVEEIAAYTKKMDLESQVSIGLKLLTEDEKISLLNFADIVIQPFAKHTQSYVAVDPPIFLLEAMSCGKPVITSKSYSFQSFIKNGYNGFTIDWDDSSQFREALRGCTSNSAIGSNARRTVLDNFGHDFVADKVGAMYNDYN
jgi:glycosyltransferase involved in cell wall biosynthesis